MKLSQKNKRNLPAEIVRIVESENFLTTDEITRLDLDDSHIGRMLIMTVNNPSTRFFVLEDRVYWVHPQYYNKNYCEVIPWSSLRKRVLEDSLKRVTPYELLMTHTLYSDIGCVCINGLSISVGDDGVKTLEIRKDLSGSDNPYPVPKARCYEKSQWLKPVNGKVTISRYDCNLESVKTIEDVICVWLCGNNKIYVYVK